MTLADQAPRLRQRITRTFTDTVAVKRHATTADSEGNPVGTTTTVATIDGRLSKPSAADLQVAAQTGQRLDGVLTVAYDAAVEPGMLVEVRGETWRVTTIAASLVQAKANLVRVEN